MSCSVTQREWVCGELCAGQWGVWALTTAVCSQITVECTFLDYIMGGCQLNFTVSTSLNVPEFALLEEHFMGCGLPPAELTGDETCTLHGLLGQGPGCSLELPSAGDPVLLLQKADMYRAVIARRDLSNRGISQTGKQAFACARGVTVHG